MQPSSPQHVEHAICVECVEDDNALPPELLVGDVADDGVADDGGSGPLDSNELEDCLPDAECLSVVSEIPYFVDTMFDGDSGNDVDDDTLCVLMSIGYTVIGA